MFSANSPRNFMSTSEEAIGIGREWIGSLSGLGMFG